jgi:GNAT superfamily N-acetyltransferase
MNEQQNLNPCELSALIQENLMAYMRLFAGLPGMFMHDESDLFWVISPEEAPGRQIFKVHWKEENIDRKIDLLLAEVGQHTDHIDWMVFPGDQPVDLNARLEARGMPGTRGGYWLWADLTSLPLLPCEHENFVVRRVTNHAQLMEWVHISEAGFGSELGCYYDAYARHGYGPEAISLHYTGYLDDIPVTSATLLDAGGTAAIYDVSTPPEFRRKGFGGAITYALMQEILRRGYFSTWIWSSRMAKSVYQRLGFVEADFGLREHKWRRME